MHNETPANALMLCASVCEHQGKPSANQTRQDVNAKSMVQINRKTPVARHSGPLPGQGLPLGQARANTNAALSMFFLYAHQTGLDGGLQRKGLRLR